MSLSRIIGTGKRWAGWLRQGISSHFWVQHCLLLQHGISKYEYRIPSETDLEIREILPCEENLAAADMPITQAMSRKMHALGARLYGAVWKGILYDYIWVVSGVKYHHHVDGFTIQLKPNECYEVDYKASWIDRPVSFQALRLPKAVLWFETHQEAALLGEDIVFKALVNEKNRDSLGFHRLFWNSNVIANVRCTRILWLKFAKITPCEPVPISVWLKESKKENKQSEEVCPEPTHAKS